MGLTAAVLFFALAHPGLKEDLEILTLGANVLRAQTPEEKGKSYRALFARFWKGDEFFRKRQAPDERELIPKAKLAALREDVDASVALHAAWECAKLFPTREFLDPSSGFFARVRKRTGLEIPPLWELVLSAYEPPPHETGAEWHEALDAYYSTRPFVKKTTGGSWTFDPGNRQPLDAQKDERIRGLAKLRRVEREQPEVFDEALRLWLPADVKATVKDGEITFSSNAGTVTVQRDELVGPKAKSPHDLAYSHCEVMIGPERSFIACYDDVKEQFPLLCVNTATGHALWCTRVWSTGAEAPCGWDIMTWADSENRVPVHRAEVRGHLRIVTNDRAVGVFGIGIYSFLETIDLATGKPLVRFSPDYWLE